MFSVYMFTFVEEAMNVCSFCEPFSNTVQTAGLVWGLIKKTAVWQWWLLGEPQAL
jgi:hypothetical protein